MTHNDIMEKIYGIYRYANIKAFPICCIDLLDKLDIKHINYADLSDKKKEMCLAVSNDAFILKNIIYYNGNQENTMRLRFSIMHELGHIMLKHSEKRNAFEEHQANFFASNILAPRVVIFCSQTTSARGVMNKFLLSHQAAELALQDCEKYYLSRNRDKIVGIDSKIYFNFYNKRANRFVYKISKCLICGETAYNYDAYCPSCKKMFFGLKCCNDKFFDINSKEII